MQVTRELFNDVMVPNYNPSEVIPVRGEGSRVWDQNGKEFIDFAGKRDVAPYSSPDCCIDHSA